MKVLVVDDEEAFVDALTITLTREQHETVVARTGPEALASFERERPDVVLLDVMLPGVSGIEVCRQIRKVSDVPIIMVTARAEEVDAVVGLEVGADDYISKPYRARELLARMNAVVRRRTTEASDLGESSSAIALGELTIDPESHEVRLGGELVHLPLKEFELLFALVSNAGRVLTRGVLIDRVWGYDYVGAGKTLDVHIKRLRHKLEADPANPTRIITVRGVGYKVERS
jgi:two-component system, OmpR family, response regulator RegX3